ncbi:hypothetical protein NDN08_000261 [Rhodosorus marinus]|uniref:Meiotic nuclear division protein 1 homolog n=1 Tax=Rhodosorus marinus TaxID=101924 RepID=A0AAV8UEP0_9RHOD|nr:hypothetical protein NDN08_000261 [Rhodosorus marinus]
MSKRKGLSLEDKRSRMMEIFLTSMEPFTLKELEKVAPKKKGIISQSVKDVVQSLVDDDMVLTDKCGTQTLYWSLPSAAAQQKRRRLSTLDEQIEKTKEGISSAEQSAKELKSGREESSEREEVLKRLGKLETESAELRSKLLIYSSCDPETIRSLKIDSEAFRAGANRWTDNIFSIRSYVSEKFSIPPTDFDKNFGIAEDFDYIEQRV